MTHYTLAEHSGLLFRAVESYAVASTRDAAAIARAGGVLLPYRVAEDLATAVLRYPHPAAIAPCGVAGSFSGKFNVRGRRLWLPDDWAKTVLRLGEDCDWQTPLPELATVAEGVLDAPARCGG